MKKICHTGRMLPAVTAVIIGLLFFSSLISCNKTTPNSNPIPTWEDNGADSAVLRILVQTQQGQFLIGQYVNLALSLDSLNKKVLVRQTQTNSAGVAVLRKLYPRVIYFNCIAITASGALSGTGHVRLQASSTKDTILTVQ
jgi:hypothetical protein